MEFQRNDARLLSLQQQFHVAFRFQLFLTDTCGLQTVPVDIFRLINMTGILIRIHTIRFFRFV